MSYKLFTQVHDGDYGFKDAMERFVFLEACYHADSKGIVRFPQNEMAMMTLCSPRTISRAFNQLEQSGYLQKQGHGRYKINLGTGDKIWNSFINFLHTEFSGSLKQGDIIDINLEIEDITNEDIHQWIASGYLAQINPKSYKITCNIT